MQQNKDFGIKNADWKKNNGVIEVIIKEEKRLMGSAAGRP